MLSAACAPGLPQTPRTASAWSSRHWCHASHHTRVHLPAPLPPSPLSYPACLCSCVWVSLRAACVLVAGRCAVRCMWPCSSTCAPPLHPEPNERRDELDPPTGATGERANGTLTHTHRHRQQSGEEEESVCVHSAFTVAAAALSSIRLVVCRVEWDRHLRPHCVRPAQSRFGGGASIDARRTSGRWWISLSHVLFLILLLPFPSLPHQCPLPPPISTPPSWRTCRSRLSRLSSSAALTATSCRSVAPSSSDRVSGTGRECERARNEAATATSRNHDADIVHLPTI